MNPTIFLDRDGVIIENRADYVRRWEDVQFFPQAMEALLQVSTSVYKIVIVTNQSVIGRGIITIEDSNTINQRLVQRIETAGGRIDGVFTCPHAPQERCDCRKPEPGLFWLAQEALSLDINRSLMVGDAVTDLLAAQAAGIPHLALVRTGRGISQERLAKSMSSLRVQVYDHLQAALTAMIDE